MAAKKKKPGSTARKPARAGKKPANTAAWKEFPRPVTTVDLAIFTVKEDDLCVLLVQRPNSPREPWPDIQALPGGIVDINKDDDLIACAKRKLREKTGIDASYLEQVGSWGGKSRDPRGWTTTHVYFALISYVENAVLEKGSQWLEVGKITSNYQLAFDHNDLFKAAIERLRSKVEYTSLPAYLLEPPFTMPQLQQVYEVVLGRRLDKSSFRTRTLSMDFLEETGPIKTTAPRPAMGYRIKKTQSQPVNFPRPLKGGV